MTQPNQLDENKTCLQCGKTPIYYSKLCSSCYEKAHRQTRPDYFKQSNVREKRKEQLRAANRKQYALYPEKKSAKSMVKIAIKNGNLIKFPCIICGDEKSQAHHTDYGQPLAVVWLCRKHHSEYHRIERMVADTRQKQLDLSISKALVVNTLKELDNLLAFHTNDIRIYVEGRANQLRLELTQPNRKEEQ